MTSFASVAHAFFPHARRGDARPAVLASQAHLTAVAFNHALVALAAKLAAVDGQPTKAEYAAFHALFDEGDEASIVKNRSLFIQRTTDNSSALQYARQIAAMTSDTLALQGILERLLRIATADAAINAAELELLRAVADIFNMPRETFRDLVSKTMTKASASPYAVLGVSSRATDAELREHYMALVQKLHPDRYQAVGASAETIAMLSGQLATVNAAYKTITSQRAKKSSREESGFWSRWNTKGASIN